MIRTLKTNDDSRDVIVFVIKETSAKTIKILEDEGAIIKQINGSQYMPIDYRNDPNLRYRDQFGKIHFWSLIEYDEVLYMDADIYIRKPEKLIHLFDHFSRWKEFACIADFGAWYNGIDGNYCNGGLFMLRPSMARFNDLIKNLDTDTSEWIGRIGWRLFEQDYFNWYFKEKQLIKFKYNRQLLWDRKSNEDFFRKWAILDKSYLEETICWHTKLWASSSVFQVLIDEWRKDVAKMGIEPWQEPPPAYKVEGEE